MQLCTGGATQAAKLPLALLTPPKPKAAPLSKLSAECRGCQVVAKMAHYAAEVGGLSGAQLDAYMTDLCKVSWLFIAVVVVCNRFLTHRF